MYEIELENEFGDFEMGVLFVGEKGSFVLIIDRTFLPEGSTKLIGEYNPGFAGGGNSSLLPDFEFMVVINVEDDFCDWWDENKMDLGCSTEVPEMGKPVLYKFEWLKQDNHGKTLSLERANIFRAGTRIQKTLAGKPRISRL